MLTHSFSIQLPRYSLQEIIKVSISFVFALFASMVHFSSFGQPNITRSLFIKSKVCSNEDKGRFNRVALGNRIYCVETGVNLISSTSSGDGKLIVMNQDFDTIKSFYYGGSNVDELYQINILPNGHLLLSGNTQSKDMDLATYSHAYSIQEIWLLEVDTVGNIVKGTTFGGSSGSTLLKTTISSDGYIYAVGTTLAKDYDFAHFSYGTFDDDAFIVKLDTTFNIKWANLPPGNSTDVCIGAEEVNSNRLYLVFITSSTNNDLAGNLSKGSIDMMVMLIDSNGTELWKKRYGGNAMDRPEKCLVDTVSKYLYVAGTTSSADGDITYRTGTSLVFAPNHYNRNIWVTKIDTFGNVIHSKAYGSVKNDVMEVTAISFFDNKFWIGSYYIDGGGDLESPEYPLSDTINNAWIGITDTNLNLICKYTIRSDCQTRVRDFFTNNSNLFAIGYSSDCSSWVITNTFSCDTIKNFDFILNLGDAPLGLNDIDKNNSPLFELYPNPAENILNIKFFKSANSEKFLVKVFNTEGKIIYKKETKKDMQIESSFWHNGYYYILVEQKNQRQAIIFVKQ